MLGAVSECAPWPGFGEALTGAEAGKSSLRASQPRDAGHDLQMRIRLRKCTHFLFQK